MEDQEQKPEPKPTHFALPLELQPLFQQLLLLASKTAQDVDQLMRISDGIKEMRDSMRAVTISE